MAALAAAAMLIAFLAGCTQKEQEPAGENIAFTGVIEQINDNSILVSTTDDVGFDKASVGYSDDMAEPDFNFIVGQMVKITILPQIRESYPVQVTAVKIELVAEPALSDPEHPDFTASFLRADSGGEGGIDYIFSHAQNFDALAISSVQHLPVLRFDDAASFEAFLEATGTDYQYEVEYAGEIAFAEAVKKYDDTFFADNRLLIIYVQEPSGSNRHEIKLVTIKENTLTVSVNRIIPEVGTDDMADWFIVLELSKSATANCIGWDAVAE
jgi:hypothetical protein